MHIFVHIMLRYLEPKEKKLGKADYLYYIMTKQQEQMTSQGSWGSYNDWNKLPDWEVLWYDFAREWGMLEVVKNHCQCLIGGCQLSWARTEQHPAAQDVYLHALEMLAIENWRFPFQVPCQVGQRDLPALLVPYYSYSFRQLLQMWQGWRRDAGGPFLTLPSDAYKQLTAELHEDLQRLGQTLNVLMFEKRQYSVPVEMAKQIIDRIYTGHWSKDHLYFIDHFKKALLALLPPNFLQPQDMAATQVRQHTWGEKRLDSPPESLWVFDRGPAEWNVDRRKERAQKWKVGVLAQDEERKQNVLYSYIDHQGNKIMIME